MNARHLNLHHFYMDLISNQAQQTNICLLSNCGSYENRTRISRETVGKDSRYSNEPFVYLLRVELRFER